MEGGRVGVFVNQSTGEIQDMAGAACIDFIQLHGGQDADFCSAFPKKKLIKVFWPEKYSCVAELKNDMDIFAPLCRYFLLDAGSGGGGHGRRIDSLLISEFITRKKTFMAGGLDPGNIKSALSRKPFAVDINSGVEKYPGIKDHKLIIELIKNIKTLCTID